VVVDLAEVGELRRDELELLAALHDRGVVQVIGLRWPQVVAALLAAPLDEVGRLGVLARRLIEERPGGGEGLPR
jgi:hypothetical protein